MKDHKDARFNALTGLRAIAAMMIFGFHLRKFWVARLPDFLVRLCNETFLNYTLLKGFSDKYNLTGIPRSWSLTVELTFYLLAPLIFMLGQRRKWWPFLIGSVFFCLAVLTGVFLHRAGGNGDSWLYDYLFVLNGTFFGRFVEFYIGTLLAYRILPGFPNRLCFPNQPWSRPLACLPNLPCRPDLLSFPFTHWLG